MSRLRSSCSDVLEHLAVRLRVGHRDRGLVGERLQHLEILAGVRGLRALGPQHQQPAHPLLEAQRHHHLRAEGLVGARGSRPPSPRSADRRRPGSGRARPGRSRGRPARRCGRPSTRSRALRTCMEASIVVVSRRVISSRSSRLDIERASVRMACDVVVALAEEGPVHRPAHPLAQRVEEQRDQEHEGGREPRRPGEVGLGQQRVGGGEQQRVGPGDEAGQPGVDDRAPDDHGGVEEPVAHGGVADGGRVEQHEGRAHLRVHRSWRRAAGGARASGRATRRAPSRCRAGAPWSAGRRAARRPAAWCRAARRS